MCMVLFNPTMWSLGEWIKKEERNICGFSEMRPCALGHIWRHLIDSVGSVWPVDCIFRISFKFWVCFIAVSDTWKRPKPKKPVSSLNREWLPPSLIMQLHNDYRCMFLYLEIKRSLLMIIEGCHITLEKLERYYNHFISLIESSGTINCHTLMIPLYMHPCVINTNDNYNVKAMISDNWLTPWLDANNDYNYVYW